jgi:hypothetical protein
MTHGVALLDGSITSFTRITRLRRSSGTVRPCQHVDSRFARLPGSGPASRRSAEPADGQRDLQMGPATATPPRNGDPPRTEAATILLMHDLTGGRLNIRRSWRMSLTASCTSASSRICRDPPRRRSRRRGTAKLRERDSGRCGPARIAEQPLSLAVGRPVRLARIASICAGRSTGRSPHSRSRREGGPLHRSDRVRKCRKPTGRVSIR